MYRSDNGRTEVVLHNDIYTHYPSDNTAMHDQRLHFIWHEKLIRSAAGQEYRQEVVLAHVSNAWNTTALLGMGVPAWPCFASILSLPLARRVDPDTLKLWERYPCWNTTTRDFPFCTYTHATRQMQDQAVDSHENFHDPK